MGHLRGCKRKDGAPRGDSTRKKSGWARVRSTAKVGWTMITDQSRGINTILMLVLTAAGVYVAAQANEIAETQHRATLMQSTIMQAQSGPQLSFEVAPTLLGQMLASLPTESGETSGTRSIEVSNFGEPVVNLVCDPIALLVITTKEESAVEGYSTALLPLSGYFWPGTLDHDRTNGTGLLFTIQGTDDNIGRVYALQDSCEALALSRGSETTVRLAMFVRTEFTNILGEQENRLYRVGHYGVYRVDPNVAGDIFTTIQNRAKYTEIVDLSTATPEYVLDAADGVIERTGGDSGLPSYEPLLLPPYLDPDFDLETWAITFYQEPYWGLD